MIKISRKTKETNITCSLNIIGQQNINIDTGIGFLDHMLIALASHARWDLAITCKGDINIDDHHSIEDIAIVLGQAFAQAWRERSNQVGIKRFGQQLLPMDEALVLCAVDLSGRPYFVSELKFTREFLGTLSTEMIEHFLYTFALNAQITLHLKPFYFNNNHHLAEACFKAIAYALADALSIRSGENSTKGML